MGEQAECLKLQKCVDREPNTLREVDIGGNADAEWDRDLCCGEIETHGYGKKAKGWQTVKKISPQYGDGTEARECQIK